MALRNQRLLLLLLSRRHSYSWLWLWLWLWLWRGVGCRWKQSPLRHQASDDRRWWLAAESGSGAS
jgi:hypothetical protein